MVALLMTLGDPNFQNHPNLLCVVCECRDFKSGGHLDHIKFQSTDVKPFLKGSWSRYVTNFKFWASNHSSGMTEATVVKFCTQVGCIKFIVFFGMTTYSIVGYVTS